MSASSRRAITSASTAGTFRTTESQAVLQPLLEELYEDKIFLDDLIKSTRKRVPNQVLIKFFKYIFYVSNKI